MVRSYVEVVLEEGCASAGAVRKRTPGKPRQVVVFMGIIPS